MGLFDEPKPDILLQLNTDELAIVNRGVAETSGGHEDWLREIQRRLDGGKFLRLTAEEMEKVYRYAERGNGGHQDRFKAIVRAAWRHGWVQD